MIFIEDIKNKVVAIRFWNLEKENDARVFLGKIIHENDEYYFVNESSEWRILLDEDKLKQLKEVIPELKEIFLQADVALSFAIESLPENDEIEGLIHTGIKWVE